MSSWTTARVDALTRLWREGLSASQIARSLAGGVTRNAVIGKIHRLGLSGRSTASRPGARTRHAARPARLPRPVSPPAAPDRPTRPPALPAPPAMDVETGRPEVGLASIVNIGRRQCRWPIGEPGTEGFSLCGRPMVRGAFCGCHANRAYQPPKPRNHLLKFAGM